MTDTISMTTAAEPDGAPRIATLDILRGIAILGILFMNINDMGGSLWSMFAGDMRHLGWSTADQVAWWLREILANGTARCMLEMLFGAGMVILTDRAATAAATRWQVLRRYWFRSIVLFLFGVVHLLILLWPGDILHTYGLAALIAVLASRLRPRWLLVIGLNMAVLQLVGGTAGNIVVPMQRAQIAQLEAKQAAGQPLAKTDQEKLTKAHEAKAKRAKAKADQAADVAAEDKARTGDVMSWVRFQWSVTEKIEKAGMEILFVWEAASTMLIGAALFKLGILQGLRSRRYYIGLTMIAYTIGIVTRAIGAYEQTLSGDGPYIMWATSEIGRLGMTLGHIGLVNLLVTSVAGAKLLRPFVAAGRTALTLYILQTIITLWILFPPFGFALYGHFTWAPLMVIAFVIDAVLLWVANIWVRHYRIAPVEWAWRSIIEGRRLPFRKVA
ncbi:DUF418 domain-containing protein [soil metagenome]